MKDYRYGPYDKLIEQTVAKMRIRDEFKPFVVDALKRRAFQFDFTEVQVRTDLQRLPRSLQKITSKAEELTSDGIYFPDKRKINLNPITSILHTNKGLYATFTHELYHALASVNGRDMMSRRNTITGYETFSLTESLVEGSSHSTIYSTKSKNPYYNGKVGCYFTIGFAPEMLCATFGVNRQELFAHGIQNRKELDEFLAKKSGLHIEEVTTFMNEFETNLDGMHEALYGEDIKKKLPWVRGKICEKTLKLLCAKSFNIMEKSLSNAKEEDLTPQKFEDLKYNFNKLLVATKMGCNFIRANPLNFGFSTKSVLESFEEDGIFYKNGIIQTEYYQEFKKTHEIPAKVAEFAHLVRHGTFNRMTRRPEHRMEFNRIKEDIGLKMPQTYEIREMFDVSLDTIKRNNPPEEKLEEWDNEFLKHHNLRLACIKARFKDRIEGLKRLVGIKPKLLQEGQNKPYEYTVDDLNRDSAKPIDELRVDVSELNNTSQVNRIDPNHKGQNTVVPKDKEER